MSCVQLREAGPPGGFPPWLVLAVMAVEWRCKRD